MKKFFVVALIAVALALASVATACKDDDDDGGDKTCDCTVKEHYLPCTCGGTDCTCDVKPRGYIAEKDGSGNVTGTQIPIYQSASADPTKAETSKNNIIGGYNLLTDIQRGGLQGKITKIVIVSGENYSTTKNTGVVELGEDFSATDNQSMFIYVVLPAFAD